MISRKSFNLWLSLAVLVAFVAAFAHAADGDNNENVTILPVENITVPPVVSEKPEEKSVVIPEDKSENKHTEVPEVKPEVKPADKSDEKKPIDSKIDQLIVRGREKIHQVIGDLREKLDADLIEIFPHLKEKIIALHGNIDSCYDSTISKNVTVNIFKSKLHDVVLKFFVSGVFYLLIFNVLIFLFLFQSTHENLLDGLTHEKIHQRAKALLSNVAILVELLFDCVKGLEKGVPPVRLGLTPMSVYVS